MIRDRNGQGFGLSYTDGLLASISSSACATVGFTHDALGRITEAFELDEGKPARTLARYAYDDAGDLIEATDENGASWQYTYANHLITRYTDRTGRGMNLEWNGTGADAKAIRGRLQTLGVIRESGHEHLNGSIVFNWRDDAGHVVGLYGRKIADNLRSGTAYHLYLPGPHRGVFNAEGLRGQKEVILCESIIDALTFWCAGYTNVTASFGAEGFTDDHLALIHELGLERVVIAYDRDEAGDAGAVKLAERLMAEGFGCYRLRLPHGLDANEYALKVTPAAKSLGALIRSAEWLGNGRGPVRGLVREAETVRVKEVQASRRPTGTSSGRNAEMSPTTLLEAAPSLAAKLAAKEKPEPELARADVPAVAMVALAASVEPAAPALAIECEVSGSEVVFTLGAVRYRVRGFDAKATGALKVNVLASAGEWFHVDTLDLYHAKARANYIARTAAELRLKEETVKADLGRMLLKLEMLQAAADAPASGVQMAADDERAALELLREPDLLGRIVSDFAACGVVGEDTNKLVGYLAAVSRKLAAPLAVVIQSSSAAGKSSLMDAVLAFVPEEERIKYSAMTGQSLFYMGETNLKHKVLAICEEEGASRAAYALKLLQSDGELTIASTGKDADTGNLITQQYRVEGPVSIMLTTTAIEIDEELLNRCLILTVDEGREQTEAIHRLQRQKRTLDGLKLKVQKERILSLHRNAQRLLKPLAVVNPFADQLTFLSDKTRMRRDHEKYLTLIDTIALLHQYQREVKTVLYVDWSAMNVTQATVTNRSRTLERFVSWCEMRGLSQPEELTRAVFEAYQRYLYLYRKENGQALAIRSQRALLAPLMGWCKWLSRERYVQYNAASGAGVAEETVSVAEGRAIGGAG